MTLGTVCSLGSGPSGPQLAFSMFPQWKAILLPGLAQVGTPWRQTGMRDWPRGWRGGGGSPWEGWGGPPLTLIQMGFQQVCGRHHCPLLWAETQLLHVPWDGGLGVIEEKKNKTVFFFPLVMNLGHARGTVSLTPGNWSQGSLCRPQNRTWCISHAVWAKRSCTMKVLLIQMA